MQAGKNSFRKLDKFFSLDPNKWTSLLPHSYHSSASDQITAHGLILSALKCWVVLQANAILTFMMVLHQSE
jgi:hypothetical protein